MRMLALVLFVGLVGSAAAALHETPRRESRERQRERERERVTETAPYVPSAKVPFGLVPGTPSPPVILGIPPRIAEDNDSSGDIPDEVDRCPDENDGREDEDGCPETTPYNGPVDNTRLIYY